MAMVSSSTPLAALDGVVLDTEATGLDSRTARIIQIAAVRVRALKLVESETFERLVKPDIAIPPEATAVHGFDAATVAAAPPFAAIAPELDAFLGSAIIIGHSVAYDLELLRREHERAGIVWRQPRALDVALLARLVAPTLAKYGLTQLCEFLGLEIDGRHTALGDARATVRILAALVPRLAANGIVTLAEAEAANRQFSEARIGQVVGGDSSPDLSRPAVRLDSYPYRHRVREVMSAPPVEASIDTTIGDAIRLLLERKVSSVYVRDDKGIRGIVTERDVLRAIHAHGAAALGERLDSIDRKPLQCVSDEAFLYRAIGRMERLGIRHLAVRDGIGQIVGCVTPRNLLRQRASSAIVLGDEIDAALDAETLAAAWAKLPLMAKALLAEDVDPRTVAAVASSEICLLTRRAAQLAESSMQGDGWGEAPCPFSVMVLGSAGRGESLLAADQDNAIVFEKGDPDGPEDRWFAELGKRMSDILDRSGVPYCKGGVMATNPLWRHSLAGWRQLIDGWVRRQRPEDLLNVDIFYDGIPVHGAPSLADMVWNHGYDRGHRAPDFLKLLTQTAGQWHAPFTLFGGIKTDASGRVDLKIGGLIPIVSGARALSIRHDVRQRATPKRLEGVAARGIGSPKDVAAVVEAHRVILGAILDQQLVDTEQGVPLSTRVDVDRLGKARLGELKDALHKVDLIVAMVSEGRV